MKEDTLEHYLNLLKAAEGTTRKSTPPSFGLSYEEKPKEPYRHPFLNTDQQQ